MSNKRTVVLGRIEGGKPYVWIHGRVNEKEVKRIKDHAKEENLYCFIYRPYFGWEGRRAVLEKAIAWISKNLKPENLKQQVEDTKQLQLF